MEGKKYQTFYDRESYQHSPNFNKAGIKICLAQKNIAKQTEATSQNAISFILFITGVTAAYQNNMVSWFFCLMAL